MSKYLVFEKVTEKEYNVNNKRGETLGYIEFYQPWKQFVFNPELAFFSFECLNDISLFLIKLNKGE